ncbi:peroxisomal oxidase [Lentinula raphanica]|uniref:Acyl-coenzyme A oxidase n=1 Tax=Lentinula raphanica TaxID=153919 RepID=A0AA38UJI8_9AGAR|nr:peroxisomal oxidase [Lentinula raphanica]KAJ3977508.1 peroxisomal oxidase [Lentinula raphanica]
MALENDATAQNHLDMMNARKATSIDVLNVKHLVYNGGEEWQRKEKLIRTISEDPVFDKSKRDWMTRTEKFTRGLRMINRIHELEQSLGWSKQDTAMAFSLLDEPLPISLHTTAFEPVFLLQASQKLLDKYADLIAARGILGCYLQTELGHGSNVSALETTATYIPETKEFDIHSPTLTSSKWWIGALGKTATHGVVQAKLLLPGGEDKGPHLFFVQLRSLETHQLLPGIIAGDIGPKSFNGFAATDNGFARFEHVRIPKEQMLSKFAQVTDAGEYIQPPHAKLSYGGMLYIRSGMVTTAGWAIAKAAVVSIRYAIVRRQGGKGPDGLEKQVISYPSLHVRLLPILARAYVFISLGRALSQSFQVMAQRLSGGDASLLAELHAMTSGLKVLCTTTSVQDIEDARRSMGGHGYSAFSGVGRIYADLIPSVTYEGENFVLDQQAVRAALKAFHGLFGSEGKTRPSSETVAKLTASSYYLRFLCSPRNEPPILKDTDNSDSSWNKPETLILLLEWRAALLVHEIAQAAHDPDLTIYQRVSKGSTEAFVGRRVGEMINGLRTNLGLKANDVAVLSRLYLLYLQTTVESALADLLSFGLLRIENPSRVGASRDPTRGLRMAVARNCLGLVPEAIGLTDALGFSDWELDSALGVHDGNVYQALWDKARSEPLNDKEVPDAYEESIKPMLARGRMIAERKRRPKL